MVDTTRRLGSGSGLPPAKRAERTEPAIVTPPGGPPAGRYGSEGRRRLPTLVIVLLLAAGVAVAGWLALAGQDRVHWRDVGFRVLGPEAVAVTFEVEQPPGERAVCRLEALAADFAQVGSREVTVGPAQRRAARYTARVATSQRAVTGVVHDCRPAAGPGE